jgi:hypothetical protein
MRRLLFILLLAFACHRAITAAPLAPEAVPDPLKPWVGWVLYGEEERRCPPLHGQPQTHRCVWPSELNLNLDARGGHFTLRVQTDLATWTTLPGDALRWPREVTVDGKPALLAMRDEVPALWLPAGSHEIAGRFQWERLPENLGLPRDAGLIGLTVNGRAQPVPVFDADGRLWLQAAQRAERADVVNALTLRIYRKLADGVPLRLFTRLVLDVTGEPRELVLTGALLPDFIPLALTSALPAKLEADGGLRVQLRPGRWAIEFIARYPAELASVRMPENAAEPWPTEEIWSFEANHEARVVEIEGAPVIDPRQTDLPEEWKALPAYKLTVGQTLTLRTLRRGDPQPEPDHLTLNRELWLDFAGGGYSFQDRIGGTLSRDWRLNALPDQRLGRVEIDGAPQLITQLDGHTGVEVRRGQLNLLAEGRGERAGAGLPATGWSRDFQRVAAQLHLPPGWRLFAATGVDEAPGSWVASWTLLDLFLVLIASLAMARLYGWPQAALALAALTLLWHEAGAPRWVWLHLLAAAALLKVLPAGRMARAVRHYRQLAALALVLIALPFLVDQIRLGIYPQLEIPWAGPIRPEAPPQAYAPAPAAVPEMADQLATLEERVTEPKVLSAPRKMMAAPETPPAGGAAKSDETDPNALTQTGPGLPQWHWRRVDLSWNGPVLADQTLKLYLVPPGLTLLLNLARVALLLALAWLLLRRDWGMPDDPARAESGPAIPAPAASLALLLALFTLPHATDSRAELPPPQLLGELKARLLAPPDCLPTCAQIPTMRLRFEADALRMDLDIHVLETVAIPLPARMNQWLPQRAELDGKPATGLFRGAEGELWLKLAPGRHSLSLNGLLPARGQTTLTLPLVPRRVEVEGAGWKADGIGENGVPEPQLQLSRTLTGPGETTAAEWEARPLPPFLEVTRTLRFGLDWRLQTRVRRLSPVGSPVLADIPLLEGESVTTPGVKVKNGQVAVNLAAGQSEWAWESVLEPRANVRLRAPDTHLWNEVWQADVSPIWHATSEGIAVTRHRDAGGNWLPEWQPWPGETVTLALIRPQGAPGTTLTLESSRLELRIGERATDASLNLRLRSSQGGQHTITLPDGAELRTASLDGVAYPLRQQDRLVSLPIHPGEQTVDLGWRENRGITARFAGSDVDLGLAGVNGSIGFRLGQDRWVLLTGGPGIGPAVLFWGVLAVIVLVATGLGRIPWTPLKTRHWLLLLMGLSQIEVAGALTVVGWLFALAWRERGGRDLSDRGFKILQVGLVLLTLLALANLFRAVQMGLLGLPDMQIAGNQSDAWNLNWYLDRSDAILSKPWAVSAPLWSYRLLMLAWALWLAYALLDWLRWGWNCYSRDGLWRARRTQAPADEPRASAEVQPNTAGNDERSSG